MPQDTEGIPRDVHTYISLINGCAVSRSLKQAQRLVSREPGWNPLYRNGVPACVRLESCAVQFAEVRLLCSASPPIAAYNALLKAVCNRGTPEAAVDLICEVEAAGLQPVQATWDMLLTCARQQGRHDIVAAVGNSPLIHCHLLGTCSGRRHSWRMWI